MIQGSLLVLASLVALAQPDDASATDASGAPVVLRGVASYHEVSHAGCELRAKPNDPLFGPLTLSVQPGVTKETYQLELVGYVPGRYDLAAFLECRDGSPAQLEPIEVLIVSTLPPGVRADLGVSPRPVLDAPTTRTRWPLVALIAWAGASAVWVWIKLMPSVRNAAMPAPTTQEADPHRILIGAVGRRRMTVAERGRLELLTLRALGERYLAEPTRDPARLYRGLRGHESAGPVLAMLEQWLHTPETSRADEERFRAVLQATFVEGADPDAESDQP